ncbi:hypothetical protein RMATCC62417_03833 [Rhizopus microsporus]|nr:hypothetical protein RMATCC62417_03833 [Rhizopus microsporus]
MERSTNIQVPVISAHKVKSNAKRNYKVQPTVLHDRLGAVETQTASLQQEIVDNAALKAGKHWREIGELSAGFLKRTASTRLSQTYNAELRHPEMNEVCTTP